MDRAQFLAILWLRWRLAINALRRHGEVNMLFSAVILFLGALLAVGGGVAGLAGGWLGLSGAEPMTHLIVWDTLVGVFLFFWLAGLVGQLQRSEILDLRQMLHYPVSLRGAFLLNYGSSLFVPSLLFCLPAMLGLAIGVTCGGMRHVLLFPLVLGFLFAVTAWTYCLQGWLAVVLENPRRRRSVAMTAMILLILCFQIPNLLSAASSGRRSGHGAPTDPALRPRITAQQVHAAIPVLWLPYGAYRLAEGNGWPALATAGGLWLLGWWGFQRAYRGTLRHYRGEGRRRVAVSPPAARPAAGDRQRTRTLLVERALPYVPDDVAAMAWTNLRALLRAPEARLPLASNSMVLGILLLANVMRHGKGGIPDGARPFLACALAAVSFLGVTNLTHNLFGFDRAGFRTLVLVPTSRTRILLGKNLSVGLVASFIFLVFLTLGGVLLRLRPADILLAMVSFVSLLLICSMLGNLSSVLVPVRLPVKNRKLSGLLTVAVLLFTAFTMAGESLVFLPPFVGWLCAGLGTQVGTLVTLAAALALALLLGGAYAAVLPLMGRLLQAREQKILEALTKE